MHSWCVLACAVVPWAVSSAGTSTEPVRRRLQFGNLAGLGSFFRNGGESDDECSDSDAGCAAWAAEGECRHNRAFMEKTCRQSCKICRSKTALESSSKPKQPGRLLSSLNMRRGCEDTPGYGCEERAKRGECHASMNATAMQCPNSCRLCRFQTLLKESLGCEDNHDNCARWAEFGECQKSARAAELKPTVPLCLS